MARSSHLRRCAFSLAVASAVLAGCAQEQKQEVAGQAKDGATDTAGQSAHRKPVPPKPIDELTREERIAFVELLADSGVYRCCIDPACTMCLYESDAECSCADRVRSKDPVCGECYRGWKRGKGSVKGADPADIRRQ